MTSVLSLLDGAPLPQRRPLLLLAAVHFLLLSGAEHPLAAFYDTVGVVRGMPTTGSRPRGDVAAAFADFCRAAPHRARAADRHPLDPDQRGRALLRPPARPVPHCSAVRVAGAAVPARPRHLGGPQPALRRLRLHLSGRRGRRHPHRRGGGLSRRPRVLGAGRPHLPARAPLARHGRAGRARPLTRRPILRRRGPVALGLPVARQPGALRAPARCAGQRARRRRTLLASSAATC